MARLVLALALLCGCAFAQLGNLRQITFGGENAEAYWSPDGKRLVFQSTRDGRQCDQIYVMNADGSGVRMVSTGKGRTTCAYFLKDGKHILYASTHAAGDACPPPADRSKGYVWAVYPSFDIYLAKDDGAIEKKLTDAPGYDAEATVNWKTGKIVYTSLASGDLDLWTMHADGSGKRRITRTLGYDGGAVFSHDGTKLVWRANHPATPETVARYKELLANHLTSPMKMELFVSDASGENARQITNFGCASFAPTFTPDDRQILFASNKNNCDGRQFELFVVNLDGSGLKQVTNFGGFTAFPEFSPDGRQVVFASDHNAKERYEFNIFVADWGATVSDLLREKMLADIRRYDEKLGGVLGVAAIDLATGQTISYHGDVVFPQASSIKIPILIQLFRAEREGKLRFSDTVTLTAKDVAEGGGLETELKEGPVTLPISDLIRRMIQNSDNTATNKCIDLVGMDRVNQTLDELGLDATRLRRKMLDSAAARRNDENVSTPLEMARLMEMIYRGKVIDEKACARMLTYLKLVNDDMRRAIPDSVDVASKPGELPGVRCETGLVLVPHRPFVLSVASAYLPDLRSPVGDITRIVYSYFDKLGRSNRFGRGLE